MIVDKARDPNTFYINAKYINSKCFNLLSNNDVIRDAYKRKKCNLEKTITNFMASTQYKNSEGWENDIGILSAIF